MIQGVRHKCSWNVAHITGCGYCAWAVGWDGTWRLDATGHDTREEAEHALGMQLAYREARVAA